MLVNGSPFYLGANFNLSPLDYTLENPQPMLPDTKWFKFQAVGRNTVGAFMKEMCENAGLTGQKFMNHSVRKRSITKLLHEGVEPNKIAKYSGHYNVQSINHYAVVSRKQQRQMSHILQTIPVEANQNQNPHALPSSQAAASNQLMQSNLSPPVIQGNEQSLVAQQYIKTQSPPRCLPVQ